MLLKLAHVAKFMFQPLFILCHTFTGFVQVNGMPHYYCHSVAFNLAAAIFANHEFSLYSVARMFFICVMN